MRQLAAVFFYAYVITLVAAGVWGTFFATVDHRMLLQLDVAALPRLTAASVLSQYRFLRAIEFGFGAFALIFRKEIYSLRSFNQLFLSTMLFGGIARLISLPIDGQPLWFFYIFLGVEMVGVVVIFIHTRSTLAATNGSPR